MKVRIFTDGACLENPGPGGWACVFNTEDKCKTFSGNEQMTTNNRMVEKWQLNNWKTTKNEDVKNRDLWEELAYYRNRARSMGIYINIIKIKGHAGNTFNELVDKLAKQESMKAKEVKNEA